MKVLLVPSWLKNKKFAVILIDEDDEDKWRKTVHFGDPEYEDYTQHKDIRRRDAYIVRHYKNEDWTDPETAGFWSRWLLWNLPTLKESADDIAKRFKIKISTLD